MRKLRKRNKNKLSKGITLAMRVKKTTDSKSFSYKEVLYTGYGFFHGWMIFLKP